MPWLVRLVLVGGLAPTSEPLSMPPRASASDLVVSFARCSRTEWLAVWCSMAVSIDWCLCGREFLCGGRETARHGSTRRLIGIRGAVCGGRLLLWYIRRRSSEWLGASPRRLRYQFYSKRLLGRPAWEQCICLRHPALVSPLLGPSSVWC